MLFPLSSNTLENELPVLNLNEDEASTADETFSKSSVDKGKSVIGTKTYAAPEQVEGNIIDQSVNLVCKIL